MPYKDKETQTAYARDWRKAHPKQAREARKRWRERQAEWIRSFKNVPCTDCGQRYHHVVMDFDHIEGKKKFNIGAAANAGRSRVSIQKEMKKCEVVCANCHRVRTWSRRMYAEKEEHGQPIMGGPQ